MQLFFFIASCFIENKAQTSSQTAASYALSTLIATRSQISNVLPNYLTLQRKFDVLIEAIKAEIDPTGINEKFRK